MFSLQGKSRRKKCKTTWIYPSVESAIRPVISIEGVSPPIYSQRQSDENSTDFGERFKETDKDFIDSEGCKSSQTLTQSELNDLIRDLGLSKEGSLILASRLKEKDLLAWGTKVNVYKNRESGLLKYFSTEDHLVYCADIKGLLNIMGLQSYKPEDWRLFIDSSQVRLKVVLLHNGNSLGSIPIAHSVTLKESYIAIKFMLEKIKYNEHNWIICVDLKMVNILLGQQHGYTKFPCFLCLWDSRNCAQHWTQKEWPAREVLAVGSANIVATALVPRDRIIFPPLHIKLGLVNQFIRALDKNGDCFLYICKVLSGVSYEKLKAGVLNGPEIRKLMRDSSFGLHQTTKESTVWKCFVDDVNGFFGNHKSPD